MKFGHAFGPGGRRLGLHSRPTFSGQTVNDSLRWLRIEMIDIRYQRRERWATRSIGGRRFAARGTMPAGGAGG
jgi:hypothetical protein